MMAVRRRFFAFSCDWLRGKVNRVVEFGIAGGSVHCAYPFVQSLPIKR